MPDSEAAEGAAGSTGSSSSIVGATPSLTRSIAKGARGRELEEGAATARMLPAVDLPPVTFLRRSEAARHKGDDDASSDDDFEDRLASGHS